MTFKVLCLHGYRQSAETFKSKLGALRKVLKREVEFVFVSAPWTVPPIEQQRQQERDMQQEKQTEANGQQNSNSIESSSQEMDAGAVQLGWWFSRDDDYFRATFRSDVVKGFHESVQMLTEFAAVNGPFDGVIGFSQGASLTAVLCGMQQKGDCHFGFKFAIMIAGFRSQCTPHDVYCQEKITLPALIVYGETDQVIPIELSQQLIDLFSDATVHTHPGGHFIPASSPHKNIYLDFLQRMKQRLMGQDGGDR